MKTYNSIEFFWRLKACDYEFRFALEGLQGPQKELFDMAQLHDFFQIFPDVPKVME
jgi:hypothetical protein